MLDPESDIAEPLANAIRNHQKNLAEQDKAEKNVEMLRQPVTPLEEISDRHKDDKGWGLPALQPVAAPRPDQDR